MDTVLSKKYYELGIVSYYNGEFRQALNYYDTSILYNPANVVAIVNKGNCYVDLKINDSAILCFNRSIEIASKLIYVNDYSYLFYLRGISYYNLKKYEHALTDIDSFFKKKTSDENDVLVNSLKGQCLYFLGKEDSAIISLEKVIETDLNNLTANIYLGRCYSKIDQVKARAYFTKAVEIDSKSFEAHKRWGYFENGMEQYEDAKALLETARSINAVDDDPFFFLQLAIAQAGSGQIEASLSNFKKAEADTDNKQGIAVKRLELLAANKTITKEMAAILIDDINYLETQLETARQRAELIYLKAYYKVYFKYPSQEILKDLDIAIELYPTGWQFFYWKSYLLQNKATENKEALATIDQAIKLKNIWKLYYFKAILLNDVGLNKNVACSCIKTANSLPNDNKITPVLVEAICTGKKVQEVLNLDINQFIENSSFLK